MKAIVVYTKTFPRYSARCEDCTVSFPLENQEAGSKLYDPGSSRLEVLSKIKYLSRPDLFVSAISRNWSASVSIYSFLSDKVNVPEKFRLRNNAFHLLRAV